MWHWGEDKVNDLMQPIFVLKRSMIPVLSLSLIPLRDLFASESSSFAQSAGVLGQLFSPTEGASALLLFGGLVLSLLYHYGAWLYLTTDRATNDWEMGQKHEKFQEGEITSAMALYIDSCGRATMQHCFSAAITSLVAKGCLVVEQKQNGDFVIRRDKDCCEEKAHHDEKVIMQQIGWGEELASNRRGLGAIEELHFRFLEELCDQTYVVKHTFYFLLGLILPLLYISISFFFETKEWMLWIWIVLYLVVADFKRKYARLIKERLRPVSLRALLRNIGNFLILGVMILISFFCLAVVIFSEEFLRSLLIFLLLTISWRARFTLRTLTERGEVVERRMKRLFDKSLASPEGLVKVESVMLPSIFSIKECDAKQMGVEQAIFPYVVALALKHRWIEPLALTATELLQHQRPSILEPYEDRKSYFDMRIEFYKSILRWIKKLFIGRGGPK